jgi:hypothetical protein
MCLFSCFFFADVCGKGHCQQFDFLLEVLFEFERALWNKEM